MQNFTRNFQIDDALLFCFLQTQLAENQLVSRVSLNVFINFNVTEAETCTLGVSSQRAVTLSFATLTPLLLYKLNKTVTLSGN